MKAKLIKKINEARGTKSFYWELDKKIKFLPGQYLYFTLPFLNYPDPRGATRHFTISASPTENVIRLTTRIRQESGYKKTLDELKIGDKVEVEGPTGTFIFDEKTLTDKNTDYNETTHIFLAGGIGITPFRSFIKYQIDKNLNVPIYLIYSNSDSEFVFEKELKTLQGDSVKIEFFDSSKSGHLDGVKIKKIIENWSLDINKSTWWVVGPPPFVSAMEDGLEKLKIASNNILTEKFTGY